MAVMLVQVIKSTNHVFEREVTFTQIMPQRIFNGCCQSHYRFLWPSSGRRETGDQSLPTRSVCIHTLLTYALVHTLL